MSAGQELRVRYWTGSGHVGVVDVLALVADRDYVRAAAFVKGVVELAGLVPRLAAGDKHRVIPGNMPAKILEPCGDAEGVRVGIALETHVGFLLLDVHGLIGCRGLSPVPGAGLERSGRRGSGVDRIAS